MQRPRTVAQAGEVLVELEHAPRAHAHAFEDAIAVEQAVIGYRHPRQRAILQDSVHPHFHRLPPPSEAAIAAAARCTCSTTPLPSSGRRLIGIAAHTAPCICAPCRTGAAATA